MDVLIPVLTITKTASTSAATPGQAVGYTVTVTDSGPTAYTGAIVTDDLTGVLNDAAYGGGATATAGSLSYAAPDLTWTGDLAPGASVTITYSVTVSDPDNGGKVLVNTVTSAAAGSTCPPGTVSASCQVTVAVLTPGLTIVTTASAATAVPGQTVTYTVTVTNTGQVPYTGAALADNLTGVLGDAAYNGDAAAVITGTSTPAGTVTFATPVLTWTGNLSPGDSATITYTVTVDNPDTGGHVLSGTVTSATPGSNCPGGSTDPRCTSTVPVSELAIAYTASSATTTPGGSVRITSTLDNTGQVPYAGITVSITGSDVFDDAAFDGDQTATIGGVPTGVISVTASTANWTGNIPVGGRSPSPAPSPSATPIPATTSSPARCPRPRRAATAPPGAPTQPAR